MPLPNLLFIDTNIWLDFYRVRNEIGLQLLERAEAVADRLIVTYQLESEFKKNRQSAILEGMHELKAPSQISRPGIFSDARATRVMGRNLKQAEKQVKHLRTRLLRALENPAQHDPVYKVCQRLFQKTDDLNLMRENRLKRSIRRAAYRRLLHGCPPGKAGDTSYGDAFNWEWMVHCARDKRMGLVIVSRDADYGITIDNKSYVNDHLRQEFSDRVSRKRALTLFSSLATALKSFDVPVSAKEEEAEKELLQPATETRFVSLGRLLSGLDDDIVRAREHLAAELARSTRGVNLSDLLSAMSPSGTRLADVGHYPRPSALLARVISERNTAPTGHTTSVQVPDAPTENAETKASK